MSATNDQLKHASGVAAAGLVESEMLVGIGTGSTAAHFIAALAGRLRSGELRGVRGVPTSLATAELAGEAGIELIELPASGVDLAVDGIDELSPALDAIKGLGGALLREKIVAASASRFVLIGDGSKLVDSLGRAAPIPVEVVPFGRLRTQAVLAELCSTARPRLVEGRAFFTDNGNQIVDCFFPAPFDAHEVARTLEQVPGVVAHGLFLGLASEALVALESGVERYVRSEPGTTMPVPDVAS